MSKLNLFVSMWTISSIVACAGCGSDDAGGARSGPRSMDELAAQVDEPAQPQNAEQASGVEVPAIEPPPEGAAPGTAAASSQPAPPPASEQPTTSPTTVSRSDTIDPGGGYYSAIAGARRHITSRVEDLAWIQGVQHFEAEKGRLPEDHAEFMSGVIARYGIDLPPLEEGQEYLYDPNAAAHDPTANRVGALYVVVAEETPAPAR